MTPRFRALVERARGAPPALATAICGHRGASAAAPENTLAAFRSAVQAGCELVELDVLVTRDEEIVVIHDGRLGRTTPDLRGRVAELSLAEIRACDAGQWFSAAFAGEKVPLLREALAAVAGRAAAMIEVKERIARAPCLVEKIARDLEATGQADRAVLILREPEAVAPFRARLPDVALSLVAFTRRAIRRAVASGCDGIVPYFRSATRRFLADARAAGLFVAPWTVNRARDVEFFVREGCDAIVTDDPVGARRAAERALAAVAAEIPAEPAAPAAPGADDQAKSASTNFSASNG